MQKKERQPHRSEKETKQTKVRDIGAGEEEAWKKATKKGGKGRGRRTDARGQREKAAEKRHQAREPMGFKSAVQRKEGKAGGRVKSSKLLSSRGNASVRDR